MELVAMDAKLRGMYIARQLSFHGVTFKVEEIPLERDFIKVYNLAVEMVNILWQWHCYFDVMFLLLCLDCLSHNDFCTVKENKEKKKKENAIYIMHIQLMIINTDLLVPAADW